ncbi:hypothetical protein EGW08_004178 [Elysia chlorotica]|uniref:Uncharacterized protein n=1 Tax=Elysia chlorotica TaxID=188477 RepID=A0A433U2G3_ELYCH|nr:hypothetical protein EGW08_004178 [Elysia chlorotica]
MAEEKPLTPSLLDVIAEDMSMDFVGKDVPMRQDDTCISTAATQLQSLLAHGQDESYGTAENIAAGLEIQDDVTVKEEVLSPFQVTPAPPFSEPHLVPVQVTKVSNMEMSHNSSHVVSTAQTGAEEFPHSSDTAYTVGAAVMGNEDIFKSDESPMFSTACSSQTNPDEEMLQNSSTFSTVHAALNSSNAILHSDSTPNFSAYESQTYCEEVSQNSSTFSTILLPQTSSSNNDGILNSATPGAPKPQNVQVGVHNGSSNLDGSEGNYSHRPRKELRVSVKPLSPSVLAALHRKNLTVTLKSRDRHKKGSGSGPDHRAGQRFDQQSSMRNNGPRLDSKYRASKQSLGSVSSERNQRGKILNDRGKEPSSHKTKKSINVLTSTELKALLIKSQATIRSLSKELNEWKRTEEAWKKSENGIFGRLIGKMMANIKDRRRKEGLKLHVHDLVCETILQDIEERRTSTRP